MRNIDNNMVGINHSFWVELDVETLNLVPLQPNKISSFEWYIILLYLLSLTMCSFERKTLQEMKTAEKAKRQSHGLQLNSRSWPFRGLCHSLDVTKWSMSVNRVGCATIWRPWQPSRDFQRFRTRLTTPLMVGQWGLSRPYASLPPLHCLWRLVDSSARKGD